MSRQVKLSARTKRRIRSELTAERRYIEDVKRIEKMAQDFRKEPDQKESVGVLLINFVIIMTLPLLFGLAVILSGN